MPELENTDLEHLRLRGGNPGCEGEMGRGLRSRRVEKADMGQASRSSSSSAWEILTKKVQIK